MYCYKCGKQNISESKFCKFCGTRIINAIDELYKTLIGSEFNMASDFFHCISCGKKITLKNKFCSGCGSKIVEPVITEKKDLKEKSTEQSTVVYSTPPIINKNRKKLFIAVILIALVAIPVLYFNKPIIDFFSKTYTSIFNLTNNQNNEAIIKAKTDSTRRADSTLKISKAIFKRDSTKVADSVAAALIIQDSIKATKAKQSSKHKSNLQQKPCPKCNGDGTIQCVICDGTGYKDGVKCTFCNKGKRTCSTCKGKKYL